MSARREKLLSSISLNGTGLEIGPLCWPVVAKSEAKIFYADHATTEQLKALYKGDKGVPQDQIVPIDYALQGRPLAQTVGKKKFDYIIASHVIEHVPDMVGWLQETASILKPGGVLSLAIPDKRFTFDIDRHVSTPGVAIGAHLDRRTKPDSATVFDYFHQYRTKVDPALAWAGHLYVTEKAGPHRYSLAEALAQTKVNRDTDQYVDTHCFVFTPESFIQILQALIELSLLPYKVASFHATTQNEYEFFISLEKASPNDTKNLQKSLPKVTPVLTERELLAQIAKQDELHQKIETLQSELTNITNSHSWRLTKPLRRAIQFLRAK